MKWFYLNYGVTRQNKILSGNIIWAFLLPEQFHVHSVYRALHVAYSVLFITISVFRSTWKDITQVVLLWLEDKEMQFI